MQLEVELAKGEPGESVTCEDDLLPVIKVGDEDGGGLLLDDDLRCPIQVEHSLDDAVGLDL